MRRRDRQLTDIADIDAILQAEKVFRLGISDPGASAPYVLPLNYGYEWQGSRLRFVFHGASAGRKYELLLQSPQVGFELDGSHQHIPADTACEYGFSFRSIIGTGVVCMLTEDAAKRNAVDLLMRCQTGRTFPIDDKALAKTAVYELISEDFQAKQCKGKE